MHLAPTIFGVFLFLTQYLQVVNGYSPLSCGLPFPPFGLGVILAVVLLPSRHRLAELRNAAAVPAPRPERNAIPVAVGSRPPVIVPISGSPGPPRTLS